MRKQRTRHLKTLAVGITSMAVLALVACAPGKRGPLDIKPKIDLGATFGKAFGQNPEATPGNLALAENIEVQASPKKAEAKSEVSAAEEAAPSEFTISAEVTLTKSLKEILIGLKPELADVELDPALDIKAIKATVSKVIDGKTAAWVQLNEKGEVITSEAQAQESKQLYKVGIACSAECSTVMVMLDLVLNYPKVQAKGEENSEEDGDEDDKEADGKDDKDSPEVETATETLKAGVILKFDGKKSEKVQKIPTKEEPKDKKEEAAE